MNKVFILQKRTDGIANLYFYNLKSFGTLRKAIKHCIVNLGLKPLNWTSNESFLKLSVQQFGLIPETGTKTNQIAETYQIIQMEVE